MRQNKRRGGLSKFHDPRESLRSIILGIGKGIGETTGIKKEGALGDGGGLSPKVSTLMQKTRRSIE